MEEPVAETGPLQIQTQVPILSMELGAIVEAEWENKAKIQRTSQTMSPFISRYPNKTGTDDEELDKSLMTVVAECSEATEVKTQEMASEATMRKPEEVKKEESTWQLAMLIRQNVVRSAGMQDKRRLRGLALQIRDLKIEPGMLMETGLPWLLRDEMIWLGTKAEATVSTVLTRWTDEIRAKTSKDPDWMTKPKNPPMRGLKCRQFVAVVDIMEEWLKNDRVDDKLQEYSKNGIRAGNPRI